MPVPGTELLKPLGFPEIGVSFVIHKEPLLTLPEFMLMRWLFRTKALASFRERAGCQKQPQLEGWNFPPHSLWGGERDWKLSSTTNGQWFNQSCLHKETSLKTLEQRGSSSFWVVNRATHRDAGRMAHLGRLQKPQLPYLALFFSSVRLFPSRILYNKPVLIVPSWVLVGGCRNPWIGSFLGRSLSSWVSYCSWWVKWVSLCET